MNFRFSSLGKAAVALAFAGCTQAALPRQPEAVAPPLPPAGELIRGEAPAAVKAPEGTASRFTYADGTPNYDELRRVHGEPNTDVVVNPRAVNVAQTPAVHSVRIEGERLVFPVADAQWLLNGHGPGDTLFCGAACGGNGFTRNIVSVRTVGSEVFVETKNGALTDIIQGGWLHGTQVVMVGATEDEKRQILHDPRNLINLGNCSATSDTIQLCYNLSKTGDLIGPNGGFLPAITKSWSYTEPFPGGKVGVNASFSLTISYDIEVSIGVTANLNITTGQTSVNPVFKIGLVSVVANTNPDLQVFAEYKLNKSYSQDWKLIDVNNQGSINLISLPAPLSLTIALDTNVVISLTAHVDASAAVALIGTAETSDTLSAGASYSTDNGFQPIFKNQFNSPTYGLNVSGNANAHAYAALNTDISFTLAGTLMGGSPINFGGPALTAHGGAGIVANAKASNSGGTCQVDLSGEAFLEFAGKVDFSFGLPGFSFAFPYTFPTIDKTYTPPGFPKTFSTSASVCSTGNFDAGGQQECPTGPNGTLQLCPASTPSCCPTVSGSSQCVDETTDATNCGGCGQDCTQINGAGSMCSMATCSCVCPSGTTFAGQTCPGGVITGCF